jgi:uncharacterized membrane protein
MIPLLVLIVAFVHFRLVGLRFPYFADSQIALRAALGAMFLLTASAHWGTRRKDLVRMVPMRFNYAGIWVTLTGVAEILIAAGLQIPVLALPVGIGAALMLILIFPANVRAARYRLTIGGNPVPGLGLRLVIQILFLAAIVAAVWPRR